MRILVLVNPSSHGGRAMKKWCGYAPLLPECECVVLRNIGEAGKLARTASGFDAVAAVGGDGTVNAVADGVMKNPEKSLKFGVLYAGTSPDFCRFHGIPTNRSAVEVLKRGTVRKVPVLKADGNHFFCSCNLGMGAAAAALANRLRPVLGDRLGTFCAVVRCILNSKPQTFFLNGEKLEHCNHLLITRMPYVAGGLKLNLPGLRGREYVVWYVRNLTFAGWIRLISSLYRGKPCGEFRIVSGTTRISSDSPSEVEYDGDPHGTLPVEISVSDTELNLICEGVMK